jgi:flagellin-like hook-associated protein FlgL
MTGLYVASNSTALSAQFNLTRTMGELGDVLTRLSTGLRINSGKDDPAGLIASELLKAQITGTNKAITNTQRANSLISTADSSLGQVGNLLNDIKGLVVEAANTGAMSAEQISANQLQVDASLESIDRIARTTSYGGQRLLDGSLDFRTTGANNGYISNLKIDSANFGNANAIGVNVNVQQAASAASLVYNGTGVDQVTTMDITGSVGSKSFTFGAGTSNSEIATAINQASDSTGVAAYVEGLAERGNVILSSAGANNDIVITANNTGLDAGNYSFRITKGATNDARIVTEAAGGRPGVVEISLAESYEAQYSNFAGLFNISIDTTNRVDDTGAAIPGDAATSVSITRGTANQVSYNEIASSAVAKTGNGKSISVAPDGVTNGRVSELNGWTVIVDDAATDTGVINMDNKTVRITTAGATDANIGTALSQALGEIDGTAAPDVQATLAGGALVNGDTLTFKGGAAEGEVTITYKEGATANDILKMLNNAPNVQASLAQGVDGNALIPALPSGKTYVAKPASDPTDAADDINFTSRFTSGATAQDVIDLINSKLGDKFSATTLSGDSGGGRVSYMDAAVDYGSINLDNALRFTGMDNGPLVRLSNIGPDGQKVANQQLGVKVIPLSEADIKAGIHTPILEIRLATDASGNSITTAKDISDMFDRLTAEETLGVSAEVLYPPGVDPNGRIFGVDSCGKPVEIDNCPATYGLGTVQPTGNPGVCDVNQGDLVLLGTNESVVGDYAIARIASGTDVVPVAAESDAGNGNGTETLTFGPTSALNGMTFGFTRDETQEGFDETTGKLTIFLGAEIISGAADADDLATAAVNGAIAANWESIRAYTGATGDAVKLASNVTGDDAIADADTGATTEISASSAAGTVVGTRGVGADDPALVIKSKTLGTDMAGIKIYFVNDTSRSDLAKYPATAGDITDNTALPALDVKYVTSEDGSRSLIVTGNIDDTTQVASLVNSVALASALNANDTFKTYFTAEAPLADEDERIGDVEFVKDITRMAAQTVGGYRVDSPAITGNNQTGTSSGIGMVGASDSNERLVLETTDLGSENFVNVYVAQGSFDTKDWYGNSASYSTGSDMIATINGNRATGKGNNISINTADLAVSMNVANVVGSTGFSIDGGGALFQLGPDVVSSQQMRLGIGSVNTTRLGGASGQLYQLKSGGNADLRNSDTSRKLADKIVNEAISSVATTRGRLGAVQRSSLEPNISALQDSLTALTSAEAMISNADFAEESSNLTRLQLLIQAGAQTLGIANQLPQYAASLVR